MVIETVELCTTCGEVTPHSRRRHAPLRWLAAALGLLAGTFAVVAVVAGEPLVAFLAALGAAALAVMTLGLFQADRSRRWDLACTRCRGKAVAASRPERRHWRLPLRATTIDLGP